MSTKSDDKATITITGGDDIDKRLLAHFIVQQLRRAIGQGDANLALTFEGSDQFERRVHDDDMFTHIDCRPIEIYIPGRCRVVKYDLDERGNLSAVVLGIFAVDEHSFRGMAKKTAMRLHEALVDGKPSDLPTWPVNLSYLSVGSEGDEVLVAAATLNRISLDEATAEILRSVRVELMDPITDAGR